MSAANVYARSGKASRVRQLSATVDNTQTHCGTAFSAPMPVSARTSISAVSAGSGDSREVNVPTIPRMNASGIDTIPGLAKGNHAKSECLSIDVGEPDTAGEKTISTIVEISPPYMLHNAPLVLNRRQYSEYRIVGRFAAAATAKASATRNATF